MKKSLIIAFCAFCLNSFAQAQETNIVSIIDDLTIRWDTEAEQLETYKGFSKLCTDQNYRLNLTDLLNDIHHYDTTLLHIVTRKFEKNQDPEAKATLDDIAKLETEYATKEFLKFMHKECGQYNATENNYSGKEYKKKVKQVEKELKKYMQHITTRIDVIDDHVHHLKGL